jgi:hypothetical protein
MKIRREVWFWLFATDLTFFMMFLRQLAILFSSIGLMIFVEPREQTTALFAFLY